MKRTIRTCNGIAKQVRGYTVEVVPHPKFKGMRQFEFSGEKWIVSDYAFTDTVMNGR